VSEIALGAAISEDRQRASVVAAGRNEAGKLLVDLVFYDHPRGVIARLEGLYLSHDPVAVVVNAKAQSGTLIEPLRAAGIIAVQPSAEDVAVAHGWFLDMLGDNALQHLSQQPLTDAVRAAQQRPLSGAKAWDPKVAVDQGPLVAATLATWAFTRWEELAQPGAWTL
jgi:hypothetical protein